MIHLPIWLFEKCKTPHSICCHLTHINLCSNYPIKTSKEFAYLNPSSDFLAIYSIYIHTSFSLSKCISPITDWSASVSLHTLLAPHSLCQWLGPPLLGSGSFSALQWHGGGVLVLCCYEWTRHSSVFVGHCIYIYCSYNPGPGSASPIQV